MKVKLKHWLLGAVILVLCTVMPSMLVSSFTGGEIRNFYIKARQYAYDPPRIIVNKGDEIHIRLASLDVVHGFFLERHDIEALIEPGKLKFKLRHPSEKKDFIEVEELVFKAAHAGKFRYRCSHTCGTLHPFMQGELIVRPNYPYLVGLGSAIGVLISTFSIMLLSRKKGNSAQQPAKI